MNANYNPSGWVSGPSGYTYNYDELGLQGDSVTQYMQWERVRAYPPSGTMPTVSGST